ncbi:hypothetical protein L7F22_049374 [Adiantum nelumboides]|nr:hypothetical protein [Adiantum nelumboides]
MKALGERHGSTADTVNLKHAAASVDVPITAMKVMIGIEWLENKVQDLSAANAEEEKVEEEEAEGDNVEEEAEQQELADANKDIAEVLEDLSSQGFSSAELDLGDDSPLGHFHKVLASRKGRMHLGSRSSPAKKWKPSAGGCMLVMWVPCHLYIAVDFSAEAEMHVVWMSKIYCLFGATPHPQQFLVRFNQLNLPIAVEDEVLVLILCPPPRVKKKKRKRQKPAVPIEQIVIDRVPPSLPFDLPDLNQCPPPLDPRVLILDLNGVSLSHFWPDKPESYGGLKSCGSNTIDGTCKGDEEEDSADAATVAISRWFKYLIRETTSAEIEVGAESQILRLKSSCGYKFFHGILFLGQSVDSSKRYHVFKMSINEPGSGVELINRMRQGGNGDLQATILLGGKGLHDRYRDMQVDIDNMMQWQEVRLQREAKEKKAAEEYLKRRRRERAQLAAYIYSSPQSMPKECGAKFQYSQDHTSQKQAASIIKNNDFVGVENRIILKNKADKDIMLDVCRLPAISIKNEPCCRPLQKQSEIASQKASSISESRDLDSFMALGDGLLTAGGRVSTVVDINWYSHAGDEQRETEATRDFLQEVLEERLENEAATSRLIAEITDMKSRLDDLLAKPSTGHNKCREISGLKSKDIKVAYLSSEQNCEQNMITRLEGFALDSDNRDQSDTNCSGHESIAISHQASKRKKSWLQRDYVPGNHKVEILPQPNSDLCADVNACEQDANLTGKQSRCHPDGHYSQQKSKEECSLLEKRVFLTMDADSRIGSDKDNGFDQLVPQACDFLKRMSQESCEQKTQRDVSSPKEDVMLETLCNTGTLPGCKAIKERPVQTTKVVGKPTRIPGASDSVQNHKVSPLKQQCLSRQCEDSVSFCFKSRRDSAKFLDAEKSLLASLERLDVKLAMASANINNSSRTSLVSAGHLSTKSAPCVTRRKPGSDAYSVNSTMFPSRPTTSQLEGTSLFTKRRQNIGVTNMCKDRGSHLQTWYALNA